MSKIVEIAPDVFKLADKHIKRRAFLDAFKEALAFTNEKANRYDYCNMNHRDVRALLKKLYAAILKDKKHCLRFSSESLKHLCYDDDDGKEVMSKPFKAVNKFYSSIVAKSSHRYEADVIDFILLVMGIGNGFEFIENGIKLYNGKELMKAYKRFGRNERLTSCMTGDNSIFMNLLASNPKKVDLVVFGNSEARALLWEDDKGKLILDRIYPSGSYIEHMFLGWARAIGCVYRSRYGRKLSDGYKANVTLKIPKEPVFPYLDTFLYGEVKKGRRVVLSNVSPSNSYDYIVFCDTDGGYDGSSGKLGPCECRECMDRLLYDEKKRTWYCSWCRKEKQLFRK